MLDDTTTGRVKEYFAQHPVLSRYANDICIVLTGSFAVGLGGKGADVDAKVLCPPTVYETVKRNLITAGRIEEAGEPEEEFTDVVGDYTLESVSTVWQTVQDYDDMTPLFIYGSLVYLAGNRELLDPLVRHCRNLPSTVLTREIERERLAMSQGVYAFLRSFQTADAVARMLARAAMVRAAMRLSFLVQGMAPPYDKHLFRLLSQTTNGQRAAELIRQFLGESADAFEEAAYGAVAATADWHAMYEAAAQTPVIRFRNEILRLR